MPRQSAVELPGSQWWRSRRHALKPRRQWGNGQKKSQPDKGWDFTLWWWDGTPHQTTIESTESKRCGLLRTIANSIEKPAGL